MIPLTYAELFAGAGGLSRGLDEAGWQAIAHAEIEPHARAVLRRHWPDVRLDGDVCAINGADYAGATLLSGGSPCFTAGHLVLTRRGLIPIEQVVVGDFVWTHLHRWRPVTHTMTRDADVVEMRGQGHNAMTATPDHPFWAADTERVWNGSGYTRHVRAPHWVAAAAMRGKRWATPLRVNAEQPVPEPLASEAMAYFAGLYLGDGHIARSGRKAKVVLSVNHGKADAFHGALQKTFGTVTRLPHTASTDRLEVSRTAIASMLQEHFGTLAHRKTLPLWALSAPKPWQRALLQGVLDTDGGKTPAGWRVTTVSRALAVGLRLLAARLGYSTSLNFCKRPAATTIQGRVVSQRDTWEVVLRDTARTSELRDHDYVWGLVRSVQAAGRAQVFDITVDQDHSFVCDGLVVHNCQDLSAAGKRAGLVDGARSSLFFEQVRIWRESGAPYLLWENVHGALSSNNGADFALVLSSLVGATVAVPRDGWRRGGVAAGPDAVAAWRVLDLQYFGPPQRRVRVFVLAARTGGVDPAEVLALGEGVCGHPPPRRGAGDGAPGRAAGGAGNQSMTINNDSRAEVVDDGVAPLRAGHRQQPVVLAFHHVQDPITGDVAPSLGTTTDGIGVLTADDGAVVRTLTVGGRDHGAGDSYDNTPVVCTTAAATHPRTEEGCDASEDGTGRGTPIVVGNSGMERWSVTDTAITPIVPPTGTLAGESRPRRLMPIETERLMGWPDGWTAEGIDEQGRPYRLSDTVRYRLCGNGCGVPQVRWIAERLAYAIRRAA